MFISQSTGKQEVTSYIKKTITLMAWNILVPVSPMENFSQFNQLIKIREVFDFSKCISSLK